MGNNQSTNINNSGSIKKSGNINNSKKSIKISIGAVVIVVIFIAAYFIFSGAKNDEKKILGDWYKEQNNSVLSFYQDGTCEIPYEYGACTYIFLGDNQIKVTNYYGEILKYQYEFVDKDTMIFGNDTYKRK